MVQIIELRGRRAPEILGSGAYNNFALARPELSTGLAFLACGLRAAKTGFTSTVTYFELLADGHFDEPCEQKTQHSPG